MSSLKTKKRTTFDCDYLAAKFIAAKDLALEPDLMTKCWWEYRGVHPTRRTDLFAAYYRMLYQRYYAKYYDASRSEMVSGLPGDTNIFNLEVDIVPITEAQQARKGKLERLRRSNLTSLWRARQSADELCISYPIYISAVFESACMRWRNMATSTTFRLPRPQHLYGDRARTAALDVQIDELERFVPDFRNKSLMVGSNAPHKRDFDRFLYELGKLKRVNKDLAFKRMVQQGYITPNQAEDWSRIARD